ncbi:MAG TPA: GNAT family N-acetyltransferase [Candidatus Acidoferrales bacterium]|nr:GNAT family N-acetyltransferase [Candidatus Acidoferrales bacterium]
MTAAPERLPLSVRLATSDDMEIIWSLVTQLAEFEALLAAVRGDAPALGELLFGPDARAQALIAALGSEAVGMAIFFTSISTFLGRPGIYVEDLFVLPHQRSRGVGTALMQALAGLCEERGAARLEWSVLNSNRTAIGFYQGLGASPLEDWTTYRMEGESLSRLAAAAARRRAVD